MNSIASKFKLLQNTLQQKGWLMLLMLPLLDLAGRAAFNIIYFLFALLALLTLTASWKMPPIQRNLWLALHGCIFLSLVLTDNLGLLFRSWLKYAMEIFTFFVLLFYLRQQKVSAQQFVHYLGLAGVATVLLALLMMLVQWVMEPDIAFKIGKVNKDVLPWLMPFAILWVYQRVSVNYRWLAVIGLVGTALFIAIGTQGRTATLATLLAVFVLGVLYFRIAFWRVVLAFLLMASAIVVLMPNISRNAFNVPKEQFFDRITTGRAVLWRQAIAHPPENAWVGIGFANKEGKTSVAYVGEEKVHHLHNILMDCWYEIGYLGLGAFLLWFFYHIHLLVRVYRQGSIEQKKLGAMIGAAIVAMLVESMFAISMNAHMFTVYLCMLFAILTYLHENINKNNSLA